MNVVNDGSEDINQDVGIVKIILISIFISASLVGGSSLIAAFYIPDKINYVSDGLCDIGGEPAIYVLYNKNSNEPIGEFDFYHAVLYYLSSLDPLVTTRGFEYISAPFDIKMFIYLHFILGFFVTKILISSRSKKNEILGVILFYTKRIILFPFGLMGMVAIALMILGAEEANQFSFILIFLFYIGGYFYLKILTPEIYRGISQ